jgi:hypothetical protein
MKDAVLWKPYALGERAIYVTLGVVLSKSMALILYCLMDIFGFPIFQRPLSSLEY